MFALEITFPDGKGQPETIFVRRSHAIIGGTESSHIVIDDLASAPFQIEVIREAGRSFQCNYLPTVEGATVPASGRHTFSTAINVGAVHLNVVALDMDFLTRENESPDKAAVRIARQASKTPAPLFPAIAVLNAPKMVLSFDPAQPITIGRSKQCQIRIDAPDISNQHARIGYENGNFWIEDLGTVNGIFVQGRQISGREKVAPETSIVLGKSVTIMGVTEDKHIAGSTEVGSAKNSSPEYAESLAYPILVATSDIARPARLVLTPNTPIILGRDPTSDIWLGAPHISRNHCTVELLEDRTVLITDTSSNGTAFNGTRLTRDEQITSVFSGVIDFGSNLTIGLCYSDEDGRAFIDSNGDPNVFAVQETADDFMPVSEAPLQPRVKMGGRETIHNPQDFHDAIKPSMKSSSSLSLRGKIIMGVIAIVAVFIFIVSFSLILPILR